MRPILRRVTLLALICLLATALIVPAATFAKTDRNATLQRWATDTWASFVAMTNSETGLPSDNIGGDLNPATASAYTSPTNIAMYIWAALAARDLGLIRPREAQVRIEATLTSLETMERHEPSGQYYNWYDPDTLEKLIVWPVDDSPVYPFLSSVDNGWLASALLMVANGAVPQLRDRAWALVSSMDFGFYYDPAANPDAGTGQIRGGYWPVVPIGQGARPTNSPGDCIRRRPADLNAVPPRPEPDPAFAGWTCHHYGAFNTEPRIASYIGIALGQIPAEHYFGGWRTFPDTCPWSWPETRPIGEWVDYVVDGKTLHVFEGAYVYDDQLVVPTWGGSSFEAFMVPLVVPEEEWGPASWGITHPLYAETMIEYGLDEAQYGYWGFSPSSDPMVMGGYREYGIDYVGMEPNGYTSDVEKLTLADEGWDGPDPLCARAATEITAYGQGVVTPHAAAIALDFAPDAAFANLVNLETDFASQDPAFDLYGAGGFKDAVNVETGDVADRYLSLDQGMLLAAIANELRNDRLQHYFSQGAVEQALRPLMAMEEFGAGRIGE